MDLKIEEPLTPAKVYALTTIYLYTYNGPVIEKRGAVNISVKDIINNSPNGSKDLCDLVDVITSDLLCLCRKCT